MINFAHSEVFMGGPLHGYFVAAAFIFIGLFGSASHPQPDRHFFFSFPWQLRRPLPSC